MSSNQTPRFLFLIDCISRVLYLESEFGEELKVIKQDEIPCLEPSLWGDSRLWDHRLQFYNKTCVVDCGEIMEKVDFLQVAFDISMNIGLKRSFTEEAKAVIRVLSKRLNAKGVARSFLIWTQKDIGMEQNYLSLPYRLTEKKTFRNIDFESCYSYCDGVEEHVFWFDLPNIGKLLLIRKDRLDQTQFKVLETLATKLSGSLESTISRQKIHAAMLEAERANKAKSLFLANMSHDSDSLIP